MPVGLFLSGGIDSALVAASAAPTGRLSHAYCLTFPDSGYSEWDRAAETASRFGIPLTRVELTPSRLASFVELASHADDPLADSSALAVWGISQAAAQSYKVVLSGDGGDELFGGYLTYRATALHGRLTDRMPARLAHLVAWSGRHLPTTETKVSTTFKLMRYLRAVDLRPAAAHLTWNGCWLPSDAAALVIPELRAAVQRAISDIVRRHALPDRPTLRELQALDLTEYLPNDILAKTDRMSMAHGLEVRAPLLSPALAAFALALPDRLKCGVTGPPKRLLRRLARRRCGTGVATAAKQGFSIPIHGWLRGPARGQVEELLCESRLAAIGGLDVRAVRQVVAQHMSGRRSYGWELWGLMILSAWHAARIAAVPTEPADAVRRIGRP